MICKLYAMGNRHQWTPPRTTNTNTVRASNMFSHILLGNCWFEKRILKICHRSNDGLIYIFVIKRDFFLCLFLSLSRYTSCALCILKRERRTSAQIPFWKHILFQLSIWCLCNYNENLNERWKKKQRATQHIGSRRATDRCLRATVL